MTTEAETYDRKYAEGYRAALTGFELARWQALEHFIPEVAELRAPARVLDYGAGSGLHVELWRGIFPQSELHFCDVSAVARDKFASKFPELASRYALVDAGRAGFEDGRFDAVVSVEVMEHVEDVRGYVADIFRLLRPGGTFVWTTPCANPGSVEHVYASLTGQIDATEGGSRRWRWEDPTHLRRLTSAEARALLEEAGFEDLDFRFRSHFFSFVCTYTPPRRWFRSLRDRLMTLDYAWFAGRENGSSMIGVARKPE